MTRLSCRLFFDECLSPDIITNYIEPHLESLELTAEATHYHDKFGTKSKLKDPEFVPILARHPDWVLISQDRSQNGPRIHSLKLACRQHRVTLLCLSSGVMERGFPFQGAQILAHWDRIVDCVRPRGGRYLIRLPDSGKSATIFQALECPAGYAIKNGVCLPDSA